MHTLSNMWPLRTRRKLFAIVLICFLQVQNSKCDIEMTPRDLSMKINTIGELKLTVSNLSNTTTIEFKVQHDDIVRLLFNATLELNSSKDEYVIPLKIKALNLGKSEIEGNTSDPHINSKNIFLRVEVYSSEIIILLSDIVGWIYFIAWSISFYPQIYTNYKRRSVVGLNFDFLALNIVGFVMYSIFNLGLYYVPELRAEYSNRYPRGLNPVKLNDIFFSVHACVATLVTIVQCFLYESGEQRVSFTARGILGVFAIFLTICGGLVGAHIVTWLDFIYFCSYIKLVITLIKYVPQAYMNYKRKSTIGWSIGNILLDFTGGMLSMLQVILLSFNYDDWVSIFGDPTKFGLGLFSVFFDIFFILQHYVFYRATKYEEN